MPANKKVQQDQWSQFRGLHRIEAIFLWACRYAVAKLGSGDLAALSKNPAQNLLGLGWMPAGELNELLDWLGTLAARQHNRWGVNAGQRARLLALIGGRGALSNPRTLFCLAIAIDRNYGNSGLSTDEKARLQNEGLLRPPTPFFGLTTNRPPPIGQMTSNGVCARWLSSLWLPPRLDRADIFGRWPTFESVPLTASAERRLAQARDERSLRISLAVWRSHAEGDLSLASGVPEGCFAVSGYHGAVAGVLPRVVDAAFNAKAHILALPELALMPSELLELVAYLRRADRKYPTLVVAGLVHEKRPASHANIAVVLDAQGREILRHEKMEPFTDGTLGIEDIVPRQSERYAFVDTPVGRMVVNICRDFRSDIPMFLNRVLEGSLFVVPSYSRKLEFVGEEARVLGQRQMGISVAVNPARDGLQDAAYLYAPIRGEYGRTEKQPSNAGSGTVLTFSLGISGRMVGAVAGPVMVGV